MQFGSRHPFWWKMLYSHLLELQSMMATIKWRWKCCRQDNERNAMGESVVSCGVESRARVTKRDSKEYELHNGPTAFLRCANVKESRVSG